MTSAQVFTNGVQKGSPMPETQYPLYSGGGGSASGANLGSGKEIYASTSGSVLNFRTLVAGSNVTMTQAADTVTVQSAFPSISSIGGGAELYAARIGDTLQFKTMVAGANMGITETISTLTFDATVPDVIGANVGSGAEVYAGKVGDTLDFRTIVAGSNIALTEGVSTITITSIPGTASITTWRITDEKLSGTDGGSNVAGAQTRTLNTITSTGPNPGNVTLAANKITVQPGNYLISARAIALNVGGHSAYLVEDGSGSMVLRGTSSYCLAGDQVNNESEFEGVISPAVATTYRLVHYTQTPQGGNGFGRAVGQAGFPEIYATLLLTQLS